MSPTASIEGVALDHLSPSFDADLKALQPDIVIHTAGPFQGQDYKVAKSCIANGSHYIDLADGRSFVELFSHNLHAAAKDANVLLVTGASTLPGLSSAVVAELTSGWSSVNELDITIAPAQQTPRGISTISAVLSYCGKPFDVLEHGDTQRRYGWQGLKMKRYADLGIRISAVCDVPDLSLFPRCLPTLNTVVFRAALESKLEHVTLWVFAEMTRLGLVHDWSRFASAFRKVSHISQRMGGDRGGMQVDIKGIDRDNAPQQLRWHLVAERNHGPEIPVSPALVLARKISREQLSLTGAYPCFGLISLKEFSEEVHHLDIRWETEYIRQSS